MTLHKTVGEIYAMSAIEFQRWRQFFPLLEEFRDEARNHAQIEGAIAKRRSRE
jgi:hypothetical protein